MGDDGSWSCGAGDDSYGGGGGGMDVTSSSNHCETTGDSWTTCGLGKEELSQIPWADNDSSGDKVDPGPWEKQDVAGVDAGTTALTRKPTDPKDGRKKELIGPGGGADCCRLL